MKVDIFRKVLITKNFPKFKLRSILGIINNYIFYFKYNREIAESNKRIKELHNKHKGERCFIVGTGPSLKETDFSKLKNKFVIGTNTLYRGIKEYGIKPKYWVAVGYDKEMVDNLIKLKGTDVFFGGNLGRTFLKDRYARNSYKRYLQRYENSSDITRKRLNCSPIILKNFKEIHVWKKLSKDLLKGVCGGATVVETAIQVAYYLGFKEIGLVGCDCGTTTHFDGTGDPIFCKEWWDKVLYDYKLCKNYFDKEIPDRKIINYTVGGSLEHFERRNIEEAI